jgi:hypothetical protein
VELVVLSECLFSYGQVLLGTGGPQFTEHVVRKGITVVVNPDGSAAVRHIGAVAEKLADRRISTSKDTR